MSPRALDYLYIAAAIGLTAYGQLILKWRMSQFGPLPAEPLNKVKFLIWLTFDPAIFSCLLAGFFAALAWMAAMTKFQLSYAYPLMSLSLVVVIAFTILLLGEPLTWQKGVGVALIVAGTLVLGYV